MPKRSNTKEDFPLSEKRKKNQRQHAKNNSKARWAQNWIAQKISELTGIECGKDCEIMSRPMGQSGTDVILMGDAKKLFPYAIEAGSGKSISFLGKIKQAKSNIGNFKSWLVLIKKPEFKVPIIIMDGNEFFELINENEKYKKFKK